MAGKQKPNPDQENHYTKASKSWKQESEQKLEQSSRFGCLPLFYCLHCLGLHLYYTFLCVSNGLFRGCLARHLR